ncbi:MAG: hypothetical protein HFI38_05330 [Lachnospiraceae bacterium]|nr:hypothetical protein [Lachnospiraceae bacterium]
MVVTYKCPGCGAAMEFDGQRGKLYCDSCGHQMSVDQYEQQYGSPLKEEGEDFDEESPLGEDSYTRAETDGEEQTVQVQLYHCPSCGAELMTDEHTAATICSFCGSPGLIADRMSGVRKPRAVLPFRITREEAKERFLKWTKHGLLTPPEFTSKNTLEKIVGMYVPYWLYDYQVNVALRARATRSRTTVRGDTEYTYTDHYSVYRSVDTAFERIPVDASEQMEDAAMESLEPYDYSGLKDFDMAYLSGYQAEKYNFTSDEVQGRAKNRAREAAIGVARNTIGGYHTVNVVDQRVQIQERHVDYVMLPVWVLNYRYQNQNYTFLLNGQTGKLNGRLPVSVGKMAKWFGIISGLSFAGLMAIALMGVL